MSTNRSVVRFTESADNQLPLKKEAQQESHKAQCHHTHIDAGMRGATLATPNNQYVQSHQGQLEVADLRAHQGSSCSQGKTCDINKCVPSCGPHLLVAVVTTPVDQLPGREVPASSRASHAVQIQRVPMFQCGCKGRMNKRKAETDNQYFHSIAKSTHFLAVWPRSNHGLLKQGHTRQEVLVYFNPVSEESRVPFGS